MERFTLLQMIQIVLNNETKNNYLPKILNSSNKAHKEIDGYLRELKKMIHFNPQTFKIEDINNQEYMNKMTDLKLSLNGISLETNYSSIFKLGQHYSLSKQSRTVATICCAECPEAINFTCLMITAQTVLKQEQIIIKYKGKLVESQFKYFCETHKKKASKYEIISNEQNKQNQKNEKTYYKFNQSKALIQENPRRNLKKINTPSSKYIIPTEDKDIQKYKFKMVIQKNNQCELMSHLQIQCESTQKYNSQLIQEFVLKLESQLR